MKQLSGVDASFLVHGVGDVLWPRQRSGDFRPTRRSLLVAVRGAAGQAGPAPAGHGTAAPPARRGAAPAGPSVLDRGPRPRPGVPSARVGAPRARHRRQAGPAGRPPRRPGSGSRPSAVGGLRHRGAERGPLRHPHQAPPRHHRRGRRRRADEDPLRPRTRCPGGRRRPSPAASGAGADPGPGPVLGPVGHGAQAREVRTAAGSGRAGRSES